MGGAVQPPVSVRGCACPAVGGADQDRDESREVKGTDWVVRVASGLQRAHFVQAHSTHVQDVGEDQQGEAGVAVRVGVEEGDVEVRPGSSGAEGHGRVCALVQAGGEILPGVRCQPVPFPAALGESVP